MDPLKIKTYLIVIIWAPTLKEPLQFLSIMFAIIKVISDIRKGDPGAPQIRKLGPGAQWVLLFYLGEPPQVVAPGGPTTLICWC